MAVESNKAPAQWRKEWVAALRSGNYKQGQGALRVDDCFCCLGVACDLFNNAKWERGTTRASYFLGNMSCIPLAVSLVFGLSSKQENILMELNDNDKATFAEIANYIEKEIGVDD